MQDFREKVEDRHTCKYWESAEDLKAKVIVSLTSEFKKRPGIGWIRADDVPSEATMSNIYELKNKINDLEKELEKNITSPPDGVEDLLQSDDTVDLEIRFDARPYNGSYNDKVTYQAVISPTWNEIFAAISPVLINEASDSQLKRYFKEYLTKISHEEYSGKKKLENYELSYFNFIESELDTCLVQLRALGLIEESNMKRSVKDTSTYWTLTSYGDRQMVQLRALKKIPPKSRSIGSKTKKAED